MTAPLRLPVHASESGHLCDGWRLADGTMTVIRAARRDDLPAVRDFVAGLSLQSRYRRFFHPLHTLTPMLERQLTRSNPRVEMSLLAVALHDGRETLVATAQYASTGWPQSCEFGIVVDDAWQRRGIARRMLRDLSLVARAAGFQSMQGDTLADNEPMRQLLLQSGFALSAHPDGALLRRIHKALEPAEQDCPLLAHIMPGSVAAGSRHPLGLQ